MNQSEAIKIFKADIKGIQADTDITGVQFIGIRSYKNKYGEISDQVINAGIPRHAVIKKNRSKYQRAMENMTTMSYLVQTYGEVLTKKAFSELLKSCETCLEGTNTNSLAQINAYVYITNGMKYCIATRQLMISGYGVSKTILVKGEYPVTNKRKLTLCKDDIKRLAGIKENFKQFILDIGKIGTVKIAGKTFEFPIITE